MPLMTLTTLGQKAIEQARRSSAPIKPLKFKVGNASDYPPLSQYADIRGNLIYEGYINGSHIPTGDTCIFSCIIPTGYGVGVIAEIGLYMDNGECFAVGVLNTPYEKYEYMTLTVYAYVQAFDVGRLIDQNYEMPSAINKVTDYTDLGQPNDAPKSVNIVLNGHGTGEQAPTWVIKSVYAGEKATWLGINGSLLHTGTAEFTSGTEFEIPIEEFDGYGYDLTYVYIRDGLGIGQARRISFNPLTSIYTVTDDSFNPVPDSASTLEIWSGVGYCGGRQNNTCSQEKEVTLEKLIEIQIKPLPPPVELCQGPSPFRLKKKTDAYKITISYPLGYMFGGGRGSVLTSKSLKTREVNATIETNTGFIGNAIDLQNNLGVHFAIYLMSDLYNSWENAGVSKASWREAGSDYEASRGLIDSNKIKTVIPFNYGASKFSEVGSYLKNTVQDSSGARLIAGNYNFLQDARVLSGKLNSLLIPPGLRLTVFSGTKQDGKVIADLEGPLYIANYRLRDSLTKDGGVDWALSDLAWRGNASNLIPSVARFWSDQSLIVNGKRQPTVTLGELDLAKWTSGSFRISKV